MFVRKITIGLLLTIALASVPAVAEAEEDPWAIRVGFSWMAPTGSSDFRELEREEVPGGENLSSTISDWYATGTLGFHAEMEYRLTGLIGVRLGFQHSNPDIEGSLYTGEAFLPTGGQIPDDLEIITEQFETQQYLGTVRLFPVYVGANFHVLRDSTFSFYVGGFVAAVSYGDLNFRASPVGERRPAANVRSDIAPGANVGFDWRSGDHLFWFGGIQYMPTDAVFEIEGEQNTLVLDPWYVNLGLGVRW